MTRSVKTLGRVMPFLADSSLSLTACVIEGIALASKTSAGPVEISLGGLVRFFKVALFTSCVALISSFCAIASLFD